MRVAICDDNVFAAGRMEELVYRYLSKGRTGFALDVDSFASPQELYKILQQKQRYHIYILDMLMPGIQGIDLAEKIRERDLDAQIIFMTGHEEFMPKAFSVCACGFITKPVKEEQVEKVLIKAVGYMMREDRRFVAKSKKETYIAFYKQIMYFSSDRRKITIVQIDNEPYEYYGKLKHVADVVDCAQFVQVNKSYIVNMAFIKKADGKNITLTNGSDIALTSGYKIAFHQAYAEYILLEKR